MSRHFAQHWVQKNLFQGQSNFYEHNETEVKSAMYAAHDHSAAEMPCSNVVEERQLAGELPFEGALCLVVAVYLALTDSRLLLFH